MYVRLAFAVAAHLEPEILLVDEVLAVGDAAFQKKCLGKMGNVAKEGRTVLFVSHNMNSIKRLCTTAILLNDGKVRYAGNINLTIHKYLSESINQNTIWGNYNYKNKCKYLKPLNLYACDEYGNIIQNSVSRNHRLFIVFEFDLKIKQRDLTIGVSVFDENNQHLFRTLHTDSNENINEELKVGNNKIICELPKDVLNEGTYLIKLDGSIYKKSWEFNPFTNDDISIKIEVNGDFIFSKYWQNKRAGILAPIIQWEVE
jgi:lipopolysaccharide transport system ATP-binding protein